jgi:hypothetical protein
VKTIGISSDETEIVRYVDKVREWKRKQEEEKQLKLNLFVEESSQKHREIAEMERI